MDRDERAWQLVAPTARRVLADPLGRGLLAEVDVKVGDPDTEHPETCPICGFDTLLTFPIHSAAPLPFAFIKSCMRCWAEAKRHGGAST